MAFWMQRQVKPNLKLKCDFRMEKPVPSIDSNLKVVTFGCRLNTYESQVMKREAEKAGLHELEGGAVLVNTCAVTGEAVRQITQGCIEILGPMGISREHLLEKWFRDVRITDIYEGTGEIQRMIIARSLCGYTRKDLN